ncbi:nuclear transport factor 2 family protein [Streptomyces globisporus]
MSWSRGTRVLQRQNGKWTMIHQHVSYPYDPRTGEAKINLQP